MQHRPAPQPRRGPFLQACCNSCAGPFTLQRAQGMLACRKGGNGLKRRAVWAVVALCLLLGGCAQGPAAGLPAPSQALLAAAQGLDTYRFDLAFHPDAHQLGVTLEARIRNRSARAYDDIVLRTYAGAYAAIETSPAAAGDLFERCYPHGFSPGGFVLHDVRVDGAPVRAAFDDRARTVLRLPAQGTAPGQWRDIALRMVLTVPDCLHRFGRGDGVWLLGNCLPVCSVYEDGAWRDDPYAPIGDPFISNAANYEIRLTVPEGYTAAAGAPFEAAGDGRLHAALPAARDAALVIYRSAATASECADGVLIQSLAPTATDAAKPLQIAKEVLKHYNQAYGAYPYPTLTVAAVPFAFAGMEYPGMAWVGQSLYAQDSQDALELTLAHEIAHQWFYALVGSDQYRQPWQDEALCEHATLHYVRARYGQAAYEALAQLRIRAPMEERIRPGITPGSPVDYFSDMQEYASVVYGRGAAALEALDAYTQGRVDGFLRAYAQAHAFGLASRLDFEQALADYLEQDVRALLADYLDTSM